MNLLCFHRISPRCCNTTHLGIIRTREVHDPTVAPFAVAPGEGTGVQWRCAVIVGSWGSEGLPTLRPTSQKGALQPTKDPWSSVGEKP